MRTKLLGFALVAAFGVSCGRAETPVAPTAITSTDALIDALRKQGAHSSQHLPTLSSSMAVV
jgi:hypothetical protein